MAHDTRSKLKEILSKHTMRTFFIGKCRLTLSSLDGKVLGLQGVRIEAKYRGTGEATRALTHLFECVDEFNVPTLLEVQPMDKKTNFKGLVNLYKKFNFKKIRAKRGDKYFMMRRDPQPGGSMSNLSEVSSSLKQAQVPYIFVRASSSVSGKVARWLQDVTKSMEKKGTKGALHRYFKIPEDETIPVSKLRDALKDPKTSEKTRKRIQFALNMRGI